MKPSKTPKGIYTISISSSNFTECVKCQKPINRGVVIEYDDNYDDRCLCQDCITAFAKLLGVLPND